MSEVDFQFTTSSLPQDPNNSGSYTNSLNYFRTVSGNAYISKADFRFSSFDTEPQVDYLEIRSRYAANPAQTLSGVMPSQTWVGLSYIVNAQATPADFRFVTNDSVSRPGFAVNRARTCTEGAPTSNAAATSLFLGRRQSGFLMGAGDVVFFSWPASANPVASLDLTMALNGSSHDIATNLPTNFQLYVRCNARPTKTQHSFAGTSSDSQEFLGPIPNSACSGGTWYAAVVSDAGAGHFFLFVNPLTAEGTKPTLRVGTNWAATPSELSTIANTLHQSARQIYGFTEGQVLVRQFELYNDTGPECTNCGGQGCNVCFLSAGTGSYCCRGSQFVIGTSFRNHGKGVAHEYSHGWLAIWDEYEANSLAAQCGHSVMASTTTTNNNFCYHHDATTNDHGKDRAPGTAVTSQPPVWNPNQTVVARVCPLIPQSTPDNYSYSDHDFNSQISVCTASKSTCGPGECGQFSTGCGGTISCACPSGQVCTANNTCCQPLSAAQACGDRECGSVSDGCGGTVSCGGCNPVSEYCSSSNYCYCRGPTYHDCGDGVCITQQCM